MKKYVVTLIRLGGEIEPEYGTAEYSDNGTMLQEVQVKIKKIDEETGVGLKGAKFQVLCDGTEVGNMVSDEEGNAQFTYQRELKTQSYYKQNRYCVNYNSLTSAEQKRLDQNHIFKNYGEAYQAAFYDVTRRINDDLNSQNQQRHQWSAIETEPPFGHKMSEQEINIGEETKEEKSLEIVCTNQEDWKRIDLQKKSTREYGIEASLKGALYTLYAAENIKGTDNKTIIYQKDEEVKTCMTDEKGYAGLEGILPGRYYLIETNPPTGFEIDTSKIQVDVSMLDQYVNVYDRPITGKIRLKKYFGAEKFPEANALFSVFDMKGAYVCSLVTDSMGEAVSPELLYGTYTIQQESGVEGYCLMDSTLVKIDGSAEDGIYEIEKTDLPEYAGIFISKFTVVNDKETGTYEKKAEQGAEFLIENEEETYREIITTDEEGVARAIQLNPGVYHITQLSGIDNYAMAEATKVTIGPEENKFYRITMVDENTPRKIRIHKFLENNENPIPEKNATFYIIDESKIDLSRIDFTKENIKEQIFENISSNEIAETVITNDEGRGCALLNAIPSNHDFVVIQVEGTKGYEYMKPWFSKEHTYKEEGMAKVFELEVVDLLDDWAKIKIHKQYEHSVVDREKVYADEEDAEFQVLTADGISVCELKTDENGEAVSPKLPFGKYTVVQKKGKEGFSLEKNKKVILDQEYKHKTVNLELKNEANLVEVILKKQSFETKKPLNGGIYDVYDEKNEKVTSMITGSSGESGVAAARLPYGKYRLEETVPAENFKKSEPKEFEISYETVTYKDGIGKIYICDEEEPVYGEIKLKKTGLQLSELSSSETSEYETEYERQFEYEDLPLKGAEYGLYAMENIELDDGTILWKKDTLIDRKITDETGEIIFTRQMMDGTESRKFPVGSYYYIEEKAPDGYERDERSYEVVISGSFVKREEVNKENKEDLFIDVDEPFVKEEITPINEPYVLCKGEKLNPYLLETVKVEFTWKQPPNETEIIDVSYDEDGSVALWYEQDTVYISTQRLGQQIIFSPDSSKMFADCKSLKAIYFENVNTEFVVDFSDMFADCSSLKEIDISSFEMKNARYVERMFFNCENLQQIFAMDWEIDEGEEEAEEPDAIIVEPLTDFLLGSPYELNCFEFFYHFSDGSTKKANVKEEDVILSETIAKPVGQQELIFTFTEGSVFETYVTATANVNVTGDESFSVEGGKDVTCEFEMKNALQEYSVEVLKTDEQNNPVKGAVLGLYAKADITDYSGKVLCKKDELITTSITGDHGRVLFEKIPGSILLNNTSSEMYEVREVRPPEGYYKTDDRLTFSGREMKNEAQEFPKLTDQSIPYVTLRKTWDDFSNRNGERPRKLNIRILFPDDTQESYTLEGEDDVWSVVTKIEKSKFETWKDQIRVLEEDIEHYKLVEGLYDSQSGVYDLVNESTRDGTKDIVVQKTIRADEMDWNLWQPTFSFLLEGITDEGKELKETKTITFSKSEAQQAEDEKQCLTKEVVFEKLQSGTYTISESGGESYYQISSIKGTAQEQEVQEKGICLKLRDNEENNIVSDEKTVISFENEGRKGNVTIHKKDEKGNALPNVWFALINQKGKEVQRVVTNQEGYALFEQVLIGEYEIREVQTVPGRQLLTDPIPIQMPVVVPKNSNVNYEEGTAVEMDDQFYVYDYEYEIINHASIILPETGGKGHKKIFVLCVIGAVMICVSFLFGNRKYSTI